MVLKYKLTWSHKKYIQLDLKSWKDTVGDLSVRDDCETLMGEDNIIFNDYSFLWCLTCYEQFGKLCVIHNQSKYWNNSKKYSKNGIFYFDTKNVVSSLHAGIIN